MNRRILAHEPTHSLITLACGLAALAACSQGPSAFKSGKERLLDDLTLFAENVQADRFEKAMKQLSPEERFRFDAVGGAQDSLVRRRLKALRLSTLARRPTVKLGPGGLEGIFDELPSLYVMPTSPSGDSVTSTNIPRDLP